MEGGKKGRKRREGGRKNTRTPLWNTKESHEFDNTVAKREGIRTNQRGTGNDFLQKKEPKMNLSVKSHTLANEKRGRQAELTEGDLQDHLHLPKI